MQLWKISDNRHHLLDLPLETLRGLQREIVKAKYQTTRLRFIKEPQEKGIEIEVGKGGTLVKLETDQKITLRKK